MTCRFWSGGFFFWVGSLSVHGDVKLALLWTVMLEFQQFPVHALTLTLPGLFQNILTSLFSSQDDSLDLLPDPGNAVTRLTNSYIDTVTWANGFVICSFFVMALKDLPKLCKSTIPLLKLSLNFLGFPVVRSIAQSSEYWQRKNNQVINHEH